ncbi:MAG: TetR/AcrR family transcriptional regulator [Gemmatimonadales bacterium]
MVEATERGDSRARIVAAALREFGRLGFSGARTDRIAKHAQVNKQLLYYYFGSKRGLYRSVVERAAGQLLARSSTPPESDSTPGAARQRLRGLLEAIAAEAAAVRLVLRAASEGGEAAGVALGALGGIRAAAQRAVSAGQGIGLFRDDVDPGFAAEHVVALLVGYVSLLGMLPPRADEEPHGPLWAEQVGDLLLRSLTW